MPWNDLLEIKKANIEIALEESEQEVVACPNCGQAPLDVNAQGVVNCPMGDYRSSK
jgi:4-hydroxy-3-methylbut-2-en-1-yl diphosphate synthase IspG/GcpE